MVRSPERASAPILEQREPHRPLPAAAQEQHIQVAVVVDVGMRHIEGIDLVLQAGPDRMVGEGPVTPVNEERGAPFGIERGGEQVGASITVEIVEEAPAGRARACARSGRPPAPTLLEPPDIHAGIGRIQRDQ